MLVYLTFHLGAVHTPPLPQSPRTELHFYWPSVRGPYASVRGNDVLTHPKLTQLGELEIRHDHHARDAGQLDQRSRCFSALVTQEGLSCVVVMVAGS